MPKKKPDFDKIIDELEGTLLGAEQALVLSPLREEVLAMPGVAKTHLAATIAHIDLAMSSLQLCKHEFRRGQQAQLMVAKMRKAAQEDKDE